MGEGLLMANSQQWHKLTWSRRKHPHLAMKKDECDQRFAQTGKPGEFTQWVIQILEAAFDAASTPNQETHKVEIDQDVFRNLKNWGKQ